jgi:cell division protein FtsB
LSKSIRAVHKVPWAKWAKQPSWTVLDEALPLAVGVDPSEAARIRSMEYGEVVETFIELRDTIHRALRTGELKDHVTPADFVDWLERNGVHAPSSLTDAVKARSGPSWKARCEQLKADNDRLKDLVRQLEREIEEHARAGTPPHRRQYNNLLRILYAIARQKYHWDKDKGKQSAAKNIAGALSLSGVKRLSTQTINDRLEEAAKYVADVDKR